MTKKRAAIYRSLQSLPASKTHISKMLEAFSLTGQQDSSTRCPLAQYLSIQTGYCVEVNEEDASGVSLSRPARQFVKAFDRGNFPRLIESSGNATA